MIKRVVLITSICLVFLAVGINAQFTDITVEDSFGAIKHFILMFDDFFENKVQTENITTNTFWGGKIICDNIVGGSDGDFCVDALGAGGGVGFWQVDNGWMYPNLTAGADNDINVTTVNASLFTGGSIVVTGDVESNTFTGNTGNISFLVDVNTIDFNFSDAFLDTNGRIRADSQGRIIISNLTLIGDFQSTNYTNVSILEIQISDLNHFNLSVNNSLSNFILHVNNTAGNFTVRANVTITEYSDNQDIIFNFSAGNFTLRVNDTNREYSDDFYVNRSGDIMTGNLNMSFNNITDMGLINFSNFSLRSMPVNDNINGSLFAVCMVGPTGVCLPHLGIQSGGDTQASFILRSLMIANEIVGFHSITNRTDCQAYADISNDTLKIDCNTTETGADLLVGDDIQVFGDIWLKDSEGEYHDFNVEMSLRDELYKNLTIAGINGSLDNKANLTINTIGGASIVVNINGNSTITGNSSDSIILNVGTNATPTTNLVYFNNDADLAITNTLDDNLATVALYLLGDNFTYASALGQRTGNEFIRNVYNRFLDDGPIYKSGFLPNVSATTINISTGIMKILLSNIDIVTNHSTDGNAVEIHSNGNFHQHIDNLTGFDAYSTGEFIGTNKYFNLVCGIVATVTLNGTMFCVVQRMPDTEHATADAAETDNTYVEFFPNDDAVKILYIPIVRVIIQNTPSGNVIQPLSNGAMFLDLRGRVEGGGSPPTPGITDHGQLAGLTDDDHTQYILADGSRQLTDHWDTGIFNISGGYYNGSLLCDDIVGGTDGDFCSDDTGGNTTLDVTNAAWNVTNSIQVGTNTTYNLGNASFWWNILYVSAINLVTLLTDTQIEDDLTITSTKNITTDKDYILDGGIYWLNRSSGACIKTDVTGTNITITNNC